MDHVIWHDVECGSYAADFAFWRGLAADRPDPAAPVLGLGAGTGRVALRPAGVRVTLRALDTAVSGGTGPLYAIPTYTAMLELRAELVRRGVASSSWTT